jgi:competence protein ComEA
MPDGIESLATPKHQVEGSRPDVPRPLPPRHVSERVRAWMAWFGVARLLTLGATVLLVGAGGYWLLKAPPPPVEASLPFAATTTTADVDVVVEDPSATVVTAAGSSPTTAAPSPVVVHVAGAVVVAGVYQLPAGSRVVNAIDAAGGPASSAALDGLNLAASVVDGQRVYVPVVGEVDPATVDNGPTAADAAPLEGASPTDNATPLPVDLNRATSTELETLPGVGPATAAAIIADRQRNGPFATVDDLDRVTGIGPATLARLRELVTV